jgi:hypothetical protein
MNIVKMYRLKILAKYWDEVSSKLLKDKINESRN